ncbi:Villin-4 [Cocos nucifera]|uniref:Villin-4 n=1 Tax=Cocos nucifera TaxID=13894 RepID=A0A8K0I1J1_COCNU|nr:Villin-4 [Cocos nucifera]
MRLDILTAYFLEIFNFKKMTTALKSGALRHDIHYWLGKDTSQDEAGTVAIKTVELDAALGGRAVQYREVQGHETEKFLSYFKPCIIPQQGGVASGFRHADVNEHEHETRLYVCKGKHVVHVPFARSSLNHDDIFILDTKSKIFQFNGSNSSIQERAKALEVVQYIKDTYHDGKCEVAAVDDGKLMADAEAGEFWGNFGGFAPLPRKAASEDGKNAEPVPIDADSLTREMLQTNKCYLLDCGIEVYVWMGRNTSLEERKSASTAAEDLLHELDRPKAHVIRVIEGFETVMFRSKFDTWPQTANVTVSEDGRGKVAALLKRQGLNVKGLVKTDSVKDDDEPQPHIDCTGNLWVWHVNGQEKTPLSSSDQSKFYSGDCYIFQYSYPGEDREEYLVGTWFGKKSVEFSNYGAGINHTGYSLEQVYYHFFFASKCPGVNAGMNHASYSLEQVYYLFFFASKCPGEERAAAISLAKNMVESLKSQAVQARVYEGKEPIQFLAIFQSFIVYKGGVSSGYRNFITENGIVDETYSEDGLALFRVQGSGPDNMQAIQVDPPNVQSKPQKEGTETEQFWDLLGGKSEYLSQKIGKEQESDPRLFSCDFSKGDLKITEIYSFTQDDLMTEDIFILDCHSNIFVWVGQQVDSKSKLQALSIGEKFLEHDFLLEKLSQETPVFVVMEGSEPPFFTHFFTWDSAKSAMHGNSFQRKLTILKNGVTLVDKPKRRIPTYGGRSSIPDKSQRSRSMSFSPDRVRVRGRSPAFNALAAAFENPNPRNLSTPPPAVTKLYPKSATPDSAKVASRSAAIAALTATFEPPSITPSKSSKGSCLHIIGFTRMFFDKECYLASFWVKGSSEDNAKSEENFNDSPTSVSNRIESVTIQEDVKEGEAEDDEGLPVFPYEQLKTSSTDPVSEIDVTKREAYLSSAEFREKFGMTKDAFYQLPKWKQNKLKMAVHLF